MAKHNCYRVRAPPTLNTGSLTSETPIATLVEPFHLQHYGDERAEVQELKSRLG